MERIYFFSIFLAGFIINVLLTALLKRVSLKYGIFQLKDMPVCGGIAIWFAFIGICLIAAVFVRDNRMELSAIVSASSMMFFFGMVDDLKEVSILRKFLMQFLATAFLVILGIRTRIAAIGDLANIIVTFMWVAGITNAINHLDILDGLAASVASIVSLAFFTISTLNHDLVSAVLSLALFSASSGFLVYNLPPAKIYMGNAGSHFLGFSLAAVAMNISYASLDNRIALASPLLILGFPIFDTLFLIVVRIRKGKIPFMKSNDHLALRIMNMHLSKKRALSYMSLANLFFCICGILIVKVPNKIGALIVWFVLISSILLARRMNRVPVDG